MSQPVMAAARYYSAKDLGASLKKVASDIVTTDSQSVTSRWYHSDQDVDLYVWMDEQENVIKQRVQLCGQIVEWNVLDGIRTGLVAEEENGIGLYGDGVFKFDEAPLEASVWQATDLIKYVQVMEAPLRSKLIENFVESPDIKTLTPSEFLARYGRSSQCEKTLNGLDSLIQKISRIFK